MGIACTTGYRDTTGSTGHKECVGLIFHRILHDYGTGTCSIVRHTRTGTKKDGGWLTNAFPDIDCIRASIDAKVVAVAVKIVVLSSPLERSTGGRTLLGGEGYQIVQRNTAIIRQVVVNIQGRKAVGIGSCLA